MIPHEVEYRPSTNQAQEILRLMPAGAKTTIGQLSTDQTIDHLPAWCLQYMQEHQLCTTMCKGPHKGRLKLSELGRKVNTAIKKRLEGKE